MTGREWPWQVKGTTLGVSVFREKVSNRNALSFAAIRALPACSDPQGTGYHVKCPDAARQGE